MQSRAKNVLLYVPNIIGYVRLGLLVAAWLNFSDPKAFLCFYATSVILDGVDGIAARMLNQISAFGAWLDVVIDNIGRGMVWTYLYKWGYFISVMEWLVFVCTHSHGVLWKSAASQSPPCWVQAVMAKGFKTPAGIFVVSGLHGLLICLYAAQNGVLDQWLSPYMQLSLTGLLVSGRLASLCVEAWFVWAHILDMISSESESSKDHTVVEREQVSSDVKAY